jgi:hypothetical protein
VERSLRPTRGRAFAVLAALCGVAVLGAAAETARGDVPGSVGINSFPTTISVGQTISISGSVAGNAGAVAGTDVTVRRYSAPFCSTAGTTLTVLTTGADGTFSFSETLPVEPPVSYGFIVALSQDPNRTPNFSDPDSCVTISPGPKLSAQASGSVTVDGVPFTGGVITYGSQVELGTGSSVKLSTDVGAFKVFPGPGQRGGFVPVRVTIAKSKTNPRRRYIVELRLIGGDFTKCKARHTQGLRTEAAKKPPPKRSLWASGKGTYRTRGRYSSATVIGTYWLTQDTCAGTRTVVRRGVVQVHDFTTNTIVRVHAGHSYLARSAR